MKQLFILAVLILNLSAISHSQIPRRITYQGALSENGTPVNSTKSITFRIYDVSSGGSALWGPETHQVSVSQGLFTVILGSLSSMDALAFDKTYYLSIDIGGTEITRVQLTSVGYAISSLKADYATSAGTASGVSDNVVTSSKIADGTIVDADISSSAAISNSKIAGLGSLSTLSAITTSQITDGTIANADINGSAAIAGTKISPDFGSQKIVTTDSIIAAGMRPIGCRVYQTASGQAVPHNTNTLVTFDGEKWDYGNIHNGSQPTRLTAPVSGYYLIYATAYVTAPGSGSIQVHLKLNNSTGIAGSSNPDVGYGNSFLNCTAVYYLNAGDYVVCEVGQNTNTTITLNGSSTDHYATSFGMHKLP